MCHKILVTGAAGFVARHYIDFLNSNGIECTVLGIDSVEVRKQATLAKTIISVSYTKVDMLNKQELKGIISDFRPDYVLHLAALSSVAYSWEHPCQSFLDNNAIFLNLIESIKECDLSCRILSVGSSEEYGNVREEDLPLTEGMILKPNNPYAVARVSQEQLAVILNDIWDMNIVMTRSFNHIGPGQDTRFVVPSYIEKILNVKNSGANKGKIEVGDISIVRDFVDVRDVVRAYHMLLESGKRGEVYNICSGKPVLLKRLIGLIASYLNVEIEPIIIDKYVRPNDNRIIVGSPEKIFRELSWKAEIEIENSIIDMIEYITLS